MARRPSGNTLYSRRQPSTTWKTLVAWSACQNTASPASTVSRWRPSKIPARETGPITETLPSFARVVGKRPGAYIGWTSHLTVPVEPPCVTAVPPVCKIRCRFVTHRNSRQFVSLTAPRLAPDVARPAGLQPAVQGSRRDRSTPHPRCRRRPGRMPDARPLLLGRGFPDHHG